jgi:hypothetical protein
MMHRRGTKLNGERGRRHMLFGYSYISAHNESINMINIKENSLVSFFYFVQT